MIIFHLYYVKNTFLAKGFQSFRFLDLSSISKEVSNEAILYFKLSSHQPSRLKKKGRIKPPVDRYVRLPECKFALLLNCRFCTCKSNRFKKNRVSDSSSNLRLPLPELINSVGEKNNSGEKYQLHDKTPDVKVSQKSIS